MGLVLGAGGVVGGSWLIGALEALESETGWSPSSAESSAAPPPARSSARWPPAGSRRRSWPRTSAVARSTRSRSSRHARRPRRGADRATCAYRLQRALPPIGPGSWRMAVATLLRPRRHAPTALLAGWLPRGLHLDAADQRPRRALRPGRLARPRRLLGRRRRLRARAAASVFGRDDAPPASVGDAVAASCAIPGFYHPVKIGGAPLRRRRHLLGLEPRPALRRGPRPRRLPQPDVLARARSRRGARRARRGARCAAQPAGASATRRASCARPGTEVLHPPADRRRPARSWARTSWPATAASRSSSAPCARPRASSAPARRGRSCCRGRSRAAPGRSRAGRRAAAAA